MIFTNRPKYAALAVIALVAVLAACEEDPLTIGSGLVGNEPFTTDRAVFDVFAFNRDIKAVRTNQLPIYQLGTFDHPVYGKTEARVTSQVLLSSENPIFGASRTEDESETVTDVYLYIPFLTSPSADSDQDGLPDEFDDFPDDPNGDTDGDGLTDNQERVRGTDPLMADTDGDGINDDVDDDFVQNQFARNFDLDSIYGSRDVPFDLKVERSNFFLRDLDPEANFQEAQEYFSNQRFAPTFVDSVLFDGSVEISTEQIPIAQEDDPATEDVDESTQFEYLNPGIRVKLDSNFFQRNIIDKENSAELLNQTNFKNFLRGLHFSVTSTNGELMFLFDLMDASITIGYTFEGTEGDDGETVESREYILNFIRQPTNQGQPSGPVQGNAVNTFIDEELPATISENLDTDENAERIYLKGGSGSFAEINLFDIDGGREAIDQIKANNWIINEANLVFYVDAVPGVINPPRLYLYNAETNTPLFNTLGSTPQANSLQNFPFYDGLLTGDGSSGSPFRYSVKITDYLNELVVRNAENATLGLTITPNINIFATANAMLEGDTEAELPVAATLSPLGTVLFGSNVSTADSDKKLELEIFYTQSN